MVWTTIAQSLAPALHTEPPKNTPTGSFVPPPASGAGTLQFNVYDLSAAIARANTLTSATPALIAALSTSAQALAEFLVDGPHASMVFLSDVLDLGDAERTFLSGRIGAGVAHLAMDALNYAWMAPAHEIIRTRARLGDFIYEYGPAQHLAMTEAKGSVRRAATAGGALTTARRAYQVQVDPWIYRTSQMPPGVLIEHGYAVAFAACPSGASPAAAHLALVETRLPPGGSGGGSGSPHPGVGVGGAGPTSGPAAGAGGATRVGQPRVDIALLNYRTVFQLANAPSVVRAIDWLRGIDRAVPPAEFAQTFNVMESDAVEFLVGSDPVDAAIQHWMSSGARPLFAIRRRPAEQFLDWLKSMITGMPTPPALAIELSSPLRRSAGAAHTLFTDGFGLIDRNSRFKGVFKWIARRGSDRPPTPHSR